MWTWTIQCGCKKFEHRWKRCKRKIYEHVCMTMSIMFVGWLFVKVGIDIDDRSVDVKNVRLHNYNVHNSHIHIFLIMQKAQMRLYLQGWMKKEPSPLRYLKQLLLSTKIYYYTLKTHLALINEEDKRILRVTSQINIIYSVHCNCVILHIEVFVIKSLYWIQSRVTSIDPSRKLTNGIVQMYKEVWSFIAWRIGFVRFRRKFLEILILLYFILNLHLVVFLLFYV